MICNKCNHRLPNDSEFCQYCGNKIEKTVVSPVETVVEEKKEPETPVVISNTPVVPMAKEEENIGDMSPGEALNAILKMQAKNTVEAMEANSKAQPDNEDDYDFGLVPEKPIYTLALQMVEGEKEYLSKLYATSGEKIKYNRRGSMSVNGINGMIDIYDTYLPSGEPYKTIYINMYGAKKSTKAPAGFILNRPTQTRPVAHKVKPIKTRYCSRCGSMVDSKTKVCSGCGKKYFKGIRFNKFSITVIVLSLVIAAVSTLCVLQYVNTNELKSNIKDLENQVSNKQSIINRLNNGIDNLEEEKWKCFEEANFFNKYAEIVGDDGTNLYHKYGCIRLDTSDGFWIFNTTTADLRGYKKCSHCH